MDEYWQRVINLDHAFLDGSKREVLIKVHEEEEKYSYLKLQTTIPRKFTPELKIQRGVIAMSKQVVLEFPVDLPKESLQKKEVFKKGKETIVLELLREGEISQGKAAELLDMSRHDLFDLMDKYDIPIANFPPEELERQIKYAEKRKEKNVRFDRS